jgi:hypothetical protein
MGDEKDQNEPFALYVDNELGSLKITGATSSATANVNLALLHEYAPPDDYLKSYHAAERINSMTLVELRAMQGALADDNARIPGFDAPVLALRAIVGPILQDREREQAKAEREAERQQDRNDRAAELKSQKTQFLITQMIAALAAFASIR